MCNTHVYAKIPKECMYGANEPGDWVSGASLVPGRTTTPQYWKMLLSAESVAFRVGRNEALMAFLYDHYWERIKPQKRLYRQLSINSGYNHHCGNNILLSLGSLPPIKILVGGIEQRAHFPQYLSIHSTESHCVPGTVVEPGLQMWINKLPASWSNCVL